MKSFKLTITILSFILVIVVLAGIYQFINIQKETGLPSDDNVNTDQVLNPNVDVTSTTTTSISTSTASTTPLSTAKVTPKIDITKLKITDHPWTWTKTVYNNDTTVTPRIKDIFVITFMQDGRFSAKTDCNGVGGEYKISENKIVLDKMMSTLMYCEDSQESEFTKMLGEVSNFMFSQYGELILGIKYDSGSMIFR